LGWLDDVRKPDWPLRTLYRKQLPCDRFACRDPLQQLYANWFFHRKVYAKFRESYTWSPFSPPLAILSASI
jgi:hypothetical protein